MKILLLLIGALLLTPSLSGANDSEIEVRGGRVWRLGEGKTKVRMVRETVLLRVDREDSYFVQADFVFRNYGAGTTVKMGFPMWGGEDESLHSTGWRREFSTSIDGRKTTVRRVKAAKPEREIAAYWVKTVKFTRGQTRRIHVQCHAPNGANTSDLQKSCIYLFTGGNWYRSVKESVLTLRFSRPGTYLVRPCWNNAKPEIVREGPELILLWRNWQAEDCQEFDFGNAPRNFLNWSPYDRRETGTIELKVPGVSAGPYSVLPVGFVVGGRAYVSLSDWIDETRDRQHLDYCADRKGILLTSGKYRTFLGWHESGPDAPKFLSGGYSYESRMFVPVSRLSRDLHIRFRVDPQRHFIEQIFGLRERRTEP